MQKEDNIKEKEKKEKKGKLLSRLSEYLKEKDERQIRERLSLLVGFLLDMGASYLLCMAELFFDTYPLPPVLALSAPKRLPGIATGLMISLISGGLPIKYGFGFLIVILIRMLCVLLPAVWRGIASSSEQEDETRLIPFKDNAIEKSEEVYDKSPSPSPFAGLFKEPLHIKIFSAITGGLLCGLLLLIEQDFSLYSLLAALSLTALCPILTFLLSGIFGESGQKELLKLTSICLICALCVLGAREKSILGMPLSPALALLLTIYTASENGIIAGALTGALASLAFDITYAPLLILSAILLVPISLIKKGAGVAAVCGAIVIYCYYIGGEKGLVGVLPPMLLALPAYMLADKYREMMTSQYRPMASVAEGVYFAEAVTEKTKNEAAKDRLASLSEAFSSLSENFYKISDRFRRPHILGLKKLADDAFESVCEGCRNREVCWGSAYSDTLEALRQITSSLHKNGSVSSSSLPESFRAGCLRCDEMIEKINADVLTATERMIKQGKASFFADNYDDITAILDSALDSDPEEYECDAELGGKVFEYLYSIGLNAGGVAVYGKRCRHIAARKLTGAEGIDREKGLEISRKIGEIVGESLSEPIFEVGKDGMSMLLYSRPKIKAFCAHGRVMGEEGSEEAESGQITVDPFDNKETELCGDMTEAFITDNSYFYSLISDGMGSGSEAAYTANVCAMFIEKMLSAGNRADITLRMLNNVIRSENMGCGSECSATVDLFELDLMSGTASFIKSGAAPTYIAREGTVYKISSRTMPIGIIRDADARITKFDTKQGDIIVMVSDGCCPDSEDCPWLVEYLCNFMTHGAKGEGEALCETIKEEILREAVKNFPEGKERDDISAAVVIVG